VKFNITIKDRWDAESNQIVYDWWVVPGFPEGERERMNGTSYNQFDAEESALTAAKKYRASMMNPYIWESEVDL
jgi:hypothetical protein